ncbi:MAG: hypothetical protein Q8R33_14090 [Burkholderiales bacterium]|nr:hypothetical protein [Burkholderiales bacterium]
MLLRVSRLAFWLAAVAAAVALVIPTGWETGLTGLAALASLGAFGLWRAGLGELRRSGAADALLPDAAPLTRSALDEAAARLEACCAAARSFEAALHGAARVLKTELGGLHVAVYRVLGADASHAMVSELIEAQPGLQLAEQRFPLQRSALGRAVGSGQARADASGALTLPVRGPGGTVAVIEMTGLQIGFEPDALSALLALAQAQLSQRAEPASKAAGRAHHGGHSARLGENA